MIWPKVARLWVLALMVACAPSQAAAPNEFTPTAQPVNPVSLPRPTITPAPTVAATPTPIPIPTTAPTPAPTLRQLTSGGCCVQPFWSPDGSEVWFIDKPGEDSPSGIWAVNLVGGPPRLVTERVGLFSPDLKLAAYPERGQTYIERLGGERWTAPSGGRAISFSPDSQKILWQAASSSENLDRRVVEVWMANVDGGDPQPVARLIGGGVSGWFPDGQRLLVSGRESAASDSFLAALNLADGSLTEIARGPRLRGGALSPAGGRAAYQITFSGDPALDGLWLARTDGNGARRLEIFGAYRWRSEEKLLVIPLEADGASHWLLEVDAETGAVRALIDPAVTPFRVAVGDWAPSPDGRHIVFVSADDHNLWVMNLPP